jgi:hypothetical protein
MSHFNRVAAIAAEFPGVEVGASYGTPALRVKKKFMARMWEDGETLVIACASLDDKEFFIATEPDVFFESDHYRGWPGVLVRLPVVTDGRLRELIETAWRLGATRKLVQEFELARDSRV